MVDFEELIQEVVDAAKEVSTAYEWGTGVWSAEHRLEEAREALITAIKEAANVTRE